MLYLYNINTYTDEIELSLAYQEYQDPPQPTFPNKELRRERKSFDSKDLVKTSAVIEEVGLKETKIC